MGTTPIYDLPYPDPTDRARNGSVDIRALAEHLEELLTPAYAITLAPDSADQGGVTLAELASFGDIVVGTGQFALQDTNRTVRYTGPTRWFLVDFEAYAIAGGVALAEATAALHLNGSGTTPVGTDSVGGSGNSARLHVSTPVRLANGDALQLVISGTGAAASFGKKQFRIASIGAPE